MSEKQVDPKLFDEIYDQLVNETTNDKIYRSQKKSELLSKLLDLFEYLRHNSDENPVNDWFE